MKNNPLSTFLDGLELLATIIELIGTIIGI